MPVIKLLIDQLETRVRKGRDGYFLNAEGWYGGDIDKLWLKTEVEGEYGASPSRPRSRPCGATRSTPGSTCRPAFGSMPQPDTRGPHSCSACKVSRLTGSRSMPPLSCRQGRCHRARRGRT